MTAWHRRAKYHFLRETGFSRQKIKNIADISMELFEKYFDIQKLLPKFLACLRGFSRDHSESHSGPSFCSHIERPVIYAPGFVVFVLVCLHCSCLCIHVTYSIIFFDFTGYYNDVIMTTIASQITSLTIVYSIVYSDADQRKHQSSASLAFVWGIHRGPVNSPHKWPVTRKMFPFDDVIMLWDIVSLPWCQWIRFERFGWNSP